jgi:hypothetical protein
VPVNPSCNRSKSNSVVPGPTAREYSYPLSSICNETFSNKDAISSSFSPAFTNTVPIMARAAIAVDFL